MVSTRPAQTAVRRLDTLSFASRRKTIVIAPALSVTLRETAELSSSRRREKGVIGKHTLAFILAKRTGDNSNHCPSHNHIRQRIRSIEFNSVPKVAPIAMTTEAKETDQAMMSTTDDQSLAAVDQVSSILKSSIQSIESQDGAYDVSKTIFEAVLILNHMKDQATIYEVTDKDGNVISQGNVDASSNPAENKIGSSLPSASVETLAHTAIATTKSLHELIGRVNESRKGSRKSSGYAWKALESVARSSLEADFLKKSDEISSSLASLAIGVTLSTHPPDESTTKMIASAAIPSDKAHSSRRGKKCRRDGLGKVVCDENDSNADARNEAIEHSMVRAALLGLLHLAVEDTKRTTQENKNDESKTVSFSTDMHTISKIESGFNIGALDAGNEDRELARAVSDFVHCVFGEDITSDDDSIDSIVDDNGVAVARDQIPPILCLVANTRPWEYVQLEKLVRMSAEMSLWYSAELLADAAIDSVVPPEPLSKGQEKKKIMATLIPKGAKTEALLPANAVIAPQGSIAHLAAGAIIDIAFDYRLYRRADAFASKYYAFGGPERYAEARFLHACDTITKLVKKKQVQVIDKQIARVDDMVAKVSKDLILTSPSPSSNAKPKRAFHGEDIAIETMGEHIRDFSLRRLRASNMHAAAIRLAKIWDMEYDQDPLMLEAERKKRKLTYLQWDDEGAPGNSSETGSQSARPLPELISDAEDLLKQFNVLENNPERTIGFDCEWHDSINGVALLQLSTLADSLLLDIPALTATKEGCDALRATVGKLFSRSTNRDRCIGFGCKDDIKRLRISPYVDVPWFPQSEKMVDIHDLRNMIAELNPNLGGRGGMHFGLSRACEIFLGKQLEKAEQCSDWLARPLSAEQREYGALDAWACVAISAKIAKGLEKLPVPADLGKIE